MSITTCSSMRIGHEKCEVGPGDLIYIPPNAVHSISPLGNEPVRGLAFAASFLFLPALLPRRRGSPRNKLDEFAEVGRDYISDP
ncbi:hypothetical protein ELH26_35870 [Rhizobium leguminosarum]|uniref:Cupin type-2 domain-containing protein n=1 Tax=Rhizobium beringeri TaxID=3019934 RepID=A0ABY1XHU0_9HYPH|nr:hypothetical protein ELI43_32070 [Rhizobium leguminosarum]TBC54725.1 hypothetical protein ELH27_34905 [Rhizobium leguminosarum]TBC86656.1 hypothetical protein ELH26_35870 [Rhizobium leguminosarum]TBC91863.1 hypothetical protein ELH21_27030 [Rhizobium leguminosarum]TBE58256.1 hypothetical protein ELH03_35060 [Rhizobium beringeri]